MEGEGKEVGGQEGGRDGRGKEEGGRAYYTEKKNQLPANGKEIPCYQLEIKNAFVNIFAECFNRHQAENKEPPSICTGAS